MGWGEPKGPQVDERRGTESADDLAQREARNQERMEALVRRGVQVSGVDTERLRIAVETLMSPDQALAYRHRWAEHFSEILDRIESAATARRLGVPAPMNTDRRRYP